MTNSTYVQDAPRETSDSLVHYEDRPPVQPLEDMVDYVQEYARQKPAIAALWCLGVGFVLGWKIKPW